VLVLTIKRRLFLSHYVYKLSGNRLSHRYAVRGKTHIRVTWQNFRLLLCETAGHYWVYSPHFVVKLSWYKSTSGNVIQQTTRTLLPHQHQTGILMFLMWSANWKRENSTYDNFCVPKLWLTISGIITPTCFHFVVSAVDWGGRYLRSSLQ